MNDHFWYMCHGDIKESFLTDTNNVTHPGITTYGIPVGSPFYIATFLDNKDITISTNISIERYNMYLHKTMTPEIP